MRHFYLTALVGCGLSVAAQAADMPIKAPVAVPSYTWTGWYVGGNVGYAWGSSDVSTTAPGLSSDFALAEQLSAVNTNGVGTVHPKGFTGGIQFGYNWQSGNVVIGGEADFNAFTLKGARDVSYPFSPTVFPGTTGIIHQDVKTDWLITARPRIGFTSNNVLYYGTAGVAITELHYNNSYLDTFQQVINGTPNETESGNVSKTKFGWTAGGGVEAGLGGKWTAKVEYLYVNFGTISSQGAILPIAGLRPGILNNSANLNASIVRVGFNYKLGQ